MRAFVKGPITVIQIHETQHHCCDTLCEQMDYDPVYDGYVCKLFGLDLTFNDAEGTIAERCWECVKNEVKTQFNEEGNLL